MVTINIPNGRGWIGSYERVAEDVTSNNKPVYKKHFVRFGEGDHNIGVNKVTWQLEIIINSSEQARAYEKVFRQIAEKIEKEEREE